jgi:hypothetical protein
MFVPKLRDPSEYQAAKELFDAGVSTYRVARITGIPVSTVRYWRRLGRPPMAPTPRPDFDGWRPPDDNAYCYLLGLYLGDGCVSRPAGNPRLTISLDARYPGIVGTAVDALRAVVPDAHVCLRHARGCTIIGVSHPVWMAAFPQHGPGRKARAPHSPRGVAARANSRSPQVAARGPHPLRRLTGRQPVQDEAPQRPDCLLRVRPVLLYQLLGGHPTNLL